MPNFVANGSSTPFPEILQPGPQGVRRLAGAWAALQNKTGASPMTRIEWTQAYLDSFARQDPEQVRIAALASHGELAAIIPLVQKRNFSLRYLELLGSRELYEPTELLYRDPQALTQLLDAVLRKTGQAIVLERHPGNAASLEVIGQQLKSAWAIRRRVRPNSPSVLIGEDPEQVLNAGRRSDLRRMMRRAEKQGPVSFRLISPTLDELPALMETAVRIESAGWKGENQCSLQHDSGARSFFERYATLAAQSGILRMAFMDINGHPVAMQLAVECGNSLWLLKVGYDETYADCSPGNLLMMEVIRYASQRQLKSCEFLGKAEAWTRMWTNNEYSTECIVIFPSRLSYLHAMAVLGLQKALQTIRRTEKTASNPPG